MTPFEVWFVLAILVAFCAFAAVLAWGWYRTRGLPKQ